MHRHSSRNTTILQACSNRRLMRSLLLLVGMTGCSLLLAVNMASDTHHSAAAAVDQLRHLHAELKGHVPSSYGVADGYWQLEVNYTLPSASLLARTRYLVANSNSSCWDIAAAQQEPYTAQYHPRQQAPTVSDGGTALCGMLHASQRHHSEAAMTPATGVSLTFTACTCKSRCLCGSPSLLSAVMVHAPC